jgi:dynein heavy chain
MSLSADTVVPSAQTGAWGCFDEFNRIDVEVLSVVSSQLQSIQNALNQDKSHFELMGKVILAACAKRAAELTPAPALARPQEIRLRKNVGFFITMNPGYEGRTELPDNLKARAHARPAPSLRLSRLTRAPWT